MAFFPALKSGNETVSELDSSRYTDVKRDPERTRL
jgi:hypothetical protein